MVHFTSDRYARLSFLLPSWIHIEYAVEASLIFWPHGVDGDVAGPSVRDVELDVWILQADACRRAGFVGQDRLLVFVEPADLVDSVACRSDEGAAEVHRLTNFNSDRV